MTGNFKPNMTGTFDNFIISIIIVHNSDITHYFDNYFDFQANFIIFLSNKLFRSKTQYNFYFKFGF